MKSTTDQCCRLPFPVVWACLFFGALWWLDFPKPMTDDLFQCGAAFNLAAGGDFSNPLIVRQQFPGHFFFVYPPLHSFALAGWLKIFGIGTGSATGFQLLMYLLISWSTVAILRRHSAPRWLEWLAPLGISTTLVPLGLRPEPLAVALTLTGLALLDSGGTRARTLLPGFLLMFLGGSTAPRLVIFAGALLLVAAFRLWRNCRANRERLVLYASMIAALFAASLLFLCLIDFRLGEFLRVFHYHSFGRVGGSKLFLLHRFLTVGVGITQWPALALIPLFLFVSFRKAPDPLAWMGVALLCAVPCLAVMGGLGVGAPWYLFLIFFLLAASAWRGTASSAGRAILFAVVLCALLLANSKLALDICGLAAGRINRGMAGGRERERALALRSTPEHPVLLDSDAARYVYDYRIPPGFIDWSFAAPFPAELATETKLRAGDIFVLGPDSVDILNGKNDLNVDVPVWSPLRSRKWSFHRNPRQIFIIPADQCRDTKTAPASPAQ